VIVLSQESEVRYWTHELGVDEVLLRRAIASEGSDEVKVRAYLHARRAAEVRLGHAENQPTAEALTCTG